MFLYSREGFLLSPEFPPGANGDKKAIDCHHIFPKHYLEEQGFKDDRDRNQVANYTYLDYVTNIDISDKPPMEYVGEYREKLGEEEYQKTCAENALPEGFENMEYMDFLAVRRNLMAQIIRNRTYWELFVFLWVVVFVWNLLDLLVMDWLIVCTITPDWLILEGTKGCKGYKDYAFHGKGFLIGCGYTTLTAAVFAGLDMLLLSL